MSVTQADRIISTYTADVMGVCSALFELGGMCVMHDASGCNSTYNTHDEPRWYDTDSLVFISGLSEMDALMGNDEKFIGDIVDASRALSPAFIALAGTPIPMMTGTDLPAIARVVEHRTGIPSFGFSTNGMHSYTAGAGAAFAALAERMVAAPAEKTPECAVNILGLTPLDYSVNGSANALRQRLENAGLTVCSAWAMGDTLAHICNAGRAQVNLVTASCGLAAAEVLRRRFGTPYVVGAPMGDAFAGQVMDALRASARDGTNRVVYPAVKPDASVAIIGESVTSMSLAAALHIENGISARVICPTEDDPRLFPGGAAACDENELLPALRGADTWIADPLYQPLCPMGVRFVALPHEAFSGRIFRKQIPDLITSVQPILKMLQTSAI